MNRGRPTTAGINQLSLNLSVTRSLGGSVLALILLWPPGAPRGSVTAGIFFFLAGCLEVTRGMAQCGGPTLAALGGLCDGGSLLTTVRGTSVGGATGLWVTAACGPGGAGTACLGTVLDTAELAMCVTSLLSGPLTVAPKEAGLL